MNSVLPSLGGDVVLVSLDVDASESAEQLRRYAEGQGWRWRHALATRAYLNAAADRFGTGALNPPSDATLVVDTKGNVEVHFGSKSEQRIRDLVAQARR
jgi:hypothetical protein